MYQVFTQIICQNKILTIFKTPVPTLNKTGSPSIESLPGMSAITVNEKFWQQEGVSQEKLSQWNKNLRQVYILHFNSVGC
jgi:hypothetical protein